MTRKSASPKGLALAAATRIAADAVRESCREPASWAGCSSQQEKSARREAKLRMSPVTSGIGFQPGSDQQHERRA